MRQPDLLASCQETHDMVTRSLNSPIIGGANPERSDGLAIDG
jgi:hypothetical protein